MRINNNIGALNTYSKLSSTNVAKDKSLEKLSSGLRINRAADDAAGLAISEKMRAQIKGLDQANRNAQDGVSLIQTAEGGLSETHSMLQRMRELSVQASNGTLTDEDKTNIQTEISELKTEIGKVSSNTKFNSKKLLDGNFGVSVKTTGSTMASAGNNVKITLDGAAENETFTFSVATGSVTIKNSAGEEQKLMLGATNTATLDKGTSFNFDAMGVKVTLTADQAGGALFTGNTLITTAATGGNGFIQVGANEDDTMAIQINSMTTSALGIEDIDVTSDAEGAITLIDNAISKVSTERAKLGAYQNRLEHTMNNLTTSSENITSAESRIRDVDMAKEMMNFTKTNILSQAATSMLAQANQSGQGVLSLLR
ncbi:flagellin [Clostridium grantii]|uniref:Flagellin n=1 Tax=Clostridium grantii DSM 8605 TaxID=1121316 RepID=A0A1M5W7I3_9CLOT|nr:flagellin [Clostridium grantii]SHH83440.1 flagellin [Clostridium grantii DSM 8605]